jgi:hypothetical protein
VSSDNATHIAFSHFVTASDFELRGITPEDIRYAMMAIATGATLEDLRFRIGPALFAILQANADNLKAERAMATLTEHFDIDEAEFESEEFGPAVFGASLVNFPRTLKTRNRTQQFMPRYSPLSSHSIR